MDLIRKNLGDTLNEHVHKLIRIKRDGQPTTSVRIIWTNHEVAPPNELVVFKDMPSGESPNMSIKEVDPRPPTCCNCNEKGHIKKWCPKQKGNGVVVHCDINQQEAVNSTSTEGDQSALSVNHWFRDRHHGGAVTQRTTMMKERESNDEQYDLKMIMQEIKAMREEIKILKTEQQQLKGVNLVKNQSSPSSLEDSNNDHTLTGRAPSDNDPNDRRNENDNDSNGVSTDDTDDRSDGEQRDIDGDLIDSDGIKEVDAEKSESDSTIKNALLTGNENDDEKGKKEQGYETLLDKKGKESQQDTFTSPITKNASERLKRATVIYGTV